MAESAREREIKMEMLCNRMVFKHTINNKRKET